MRPVLCAMALSGIVSSTIALGQPVTSVFDKPCLPDFEFMPQRKFAIGCPIVDPKLGCDPQAGLSLQMQLQAPEGVEARLVFSNLADAELRALSLRGTASWADRSTVVVRPGRSQIDGLAAAKSPAPMMLMSLDARDWSRTAQKLPLEKPPKVVLHLDQFVGTVPVDRTEILSRYRNCPPPKGGVEEDQIQLIRNTSGRDAVALIDGKRGSCMVNEWDFGKSEILLQNMVSSTGCLNDSRATIFTQAHAVDFVVNTDTDPGVIVWTAVMGEKLPRTLKAPVVQPVKVWLLRNWNCIDTNGNPAACKDRAEAMMLYAKDRYPAAYGGLTFDFFTPIDLSGDNRPEANNARFLDCGSKASADDPTKPRVDAIKGLPESNVPPTKPHLEVFFVNYAGGDNGRWCGISALEESMPEYGNLILVAASGRDVVFAHELGHALMNSGHHTDTSGDTLFKDDNLMRSGASGGYLTIGQLFRANLQQGGSLDRHKARVGSFVQCLEFADNDVCPRASCDVDRLTDPPYAPGGPACEP